MHWLELLILSVAALALIPLLVLFVGTLLSLDPGRAHAAASAALPLLADPAVSPDGLLRIRVAGMDFRARVANLRGRGDGVILLHGWPQTSASWQPVMTELARLGYRVAAFDQRGYSPGARPTGIAAYALEQLVADVIGIADALGFDRFHLAGHDWGAAVGWSVLIARPDRILSWSALSIAHPAAFGEALRRDADQRRRSRYIQFFRLPFLPELLLGFNRNQLMRR